MWTAVLKFKAAWNWPAWLPYIGPFQYLCSDDDYERVQK